MTRLAMVLFVLVAGSGRVMAQDCIASAPYPDAVWTAASADDTLASVPMKVMTHLRCMGCKPEMSMLLAAGAASPVWKSVPIGQKVGMEWARAVIEDPAQREGFLQSVLRSKSRSSPGCSLQGRIGGITEIGGLGMIRTDIHAECAQRPLVVSGEFYTGYDGRCAYQVQLVWGSGFVPLSPQGRDAIQSLLKSVRFGR